MRRVGSTIPHSPSVCEDDVAVPDLVSGRDGNLLAGERDAVHEVVDVAAQLFPRLVVAHAGEPDRVDPGFRFKLKHLSIRVLSSCDLKA